MTPADPSATTAPPAGFEARLRALQLDWQAHLPGKLQEAQEALARCRAAPADHAALVDLHRLMHTLAGSAGTFGLAALGDRARAIEQELVRLQALPAGTAADFDAAARGLAALAAALPPESPCP